MPGPNRMAKKDKRRSKSVKKKPTKKKDVLQTPFANKNARRMRREQGL